MAAAPPARRRSPGSSSPPSASLRHLIFAIIYGGSAAPGLSRGIASASSAPSSWPRSPPSASPTATPSSSPRTSPPSSSRWRSPGSSPAGRPPRRAPRHRRRPRRRHYRLHRRRWLARGRLRLGFLVRFVPYPLIGGFFAAAGYLVVLGAVGMTLRRSVTIWTLGPLLHPASLSTGSMARRRRASHRSAEALREHLHPASRHPGPARGLLPRAARHRHRPRDRPRHRLPPRPLRRDEPPLRHRPGKLPRDRLGPGPRLLPAMLAVTAMALLGGLFNSSGLEIATGREIDADRGYRNRHRQPRLGPVRRPGRLFRAQHDNLRPHPRLGQKKKARSPASSWPRGACRRSSSAPTSSRSCRSASSPPSSPSSASTSSTAGFASSAGASPARLRRRAGDPRHRRDRRLSAGPRRRPRRPPSRSSSSPTPASTWRASAPRRAPAPPGRAPGPRATRSSPSAGVQRRGRPALGLSLLRRREAPPRQIRPAPREAGARASDILDFHAVSGVDAFAAFVLGKLAARSPPPPRCSSSATPRRSLLPSWAAPACHRRQRPARLPDPRRRAAPRRGPPARRSSSPAALQRPTGCSRRSPGCIPSSTRRGASRRRRRRRRGGRGAGRRARRGGPAALRQARAEFLNPGGKALPVATSSPARSSAKSATLPASPHRPGRGRGTLRCSASTPRAGRPRRERARSHGRPAPPRRHRTSRAGWCAPPHSSATPTSDLRPGRR